MDPRRSLLFPFSSLPHVDRVDVGDPVSKRQAGSNVSFPRLLTNNLAPCDLLVKITPCLHFLANHATRLFQRVGKHKSAADRQLAVKLEYRLEASTDHQWQPSNSTLPKGQHWQVRPRSATRHPTSNPRSKQEVGHQNRAEKSHKRTRQARSPRTTSDLNPSKVCLSLAGHSPQNQHLAMALLEFRLL